VGVVVIRGTQELARFVAVAERIWSSVPARVAVVGGVAVACRLRRAYRATVDVDTVTEGRDPQVVDVLVDSVGAERGKRVDEVVVDGVPVDVIETQAIGDVDGLPLEQALFLVSHRYALDEAEVVDVVVHAANHVTRGRLPLATPAALVATKLGAFLGRPPGRRKEKRPTDALDLYRLLAELNDDGALARTIVGEEPLRALVRQAAMSVLVDGSTATLREIRHVGDELTRSLTVDDLVFVGEQLIDGLGPEVGP
jgi:hypothetical protein